MAEGAVVGESWELSVEMDFPSRDLRGRLLTAHIADAREAWLGVEAEIGRDGTALLVKLLDAAAPLSVQIHPADDDPALSADESGKPESWYIVDRTPGAGLYVGLATGVDRAAIERALDEGRDLSPLLHFVPVEPGDFFLIEAGTPHCIGPGVTLVEPQHVIPGRRGVTYRFWDWNRRYDPAGREAPDGAPRPLHRERALAVADFSGPREAERLATTRLRAGPALESDAARFEPLAGPSGEAPLESPWLRVARLTGTGAVAAPEWPSLRALTLLEGRVFVAGLRVSAGQTVAIPAAWRGELDLEGAHAILSAVHVESTGAATR